MSPAASKIGNFNGVSTAVVVSSAPPSNLLWWKVGGGGCWRVGVEGVCVGGGRGATMCRLFH